MRAEAGRTLALTPSEPGAHRGRGQICLVLCRLSGCHVESRLWGRAEEGRALGPCRELAGEDGHARQVPRGREKCPNSLCHEGAVRGGVDGEGEASR